MSWMKKVIQLFLWDCFYISHYSDAFSRNKSFVERHQAAKVLTKKRECFPKLKKTVQGVMGPTPKPLHWSNINMNSQGVLKNLDFAATRYILPWHDIFYHNLMTCTIDWWTITFTWWTRHFFSPPHMMNSPLSSPPQSHMSRLRQIFV